MSNDKDGWAITVAARRASLAKVAEFIGEVCGELELNDDVAFDIQLATDEACQNAVEHACEYSAEEQVKVSCRLVGNDLEVTVSDKGAPFDPEEVSPPDITAPLHDRTDGGLGLYLMRQAMDEVHFDRSSDGVNSVTMTKKDASAHEPAGNHALRETQHIGDDSGSSSG